MGLHQRYARLLLDSPDVFMAGRKEREDEIRKQLSVLFEGMMKAVYKTEGAQLSIDILSTPQVREFIESHSSVLDSSFEKVEMSDAMRKRLHRSDFIFSGIKTFHELNEAFPSLINENGQRKSFERFLNDVRSIDLTYNSNYLRAEYNFVTASAEMAAKWDGFMQDGDRYNLQYRTQKDDKVRPEHAPLDGVTLPSSESFWAEFYPPNGWNCRCTVVQVRKSKYPATPHEEAMRLGDEALQRDSKGIFRFNPGLEQSTVPAYNQYTIRRCRDCDIRKGKFARSFVDDTQLCQACRYIHQMKVDESNRRLTKQERLDIAAAANTWADRHLPRVKMPDGTKGARLAVTLENGDELLIGKKFFSETYAKCIKSRRLAETMEMATKINEWITSARYVRSEAGRHHDFEFRVYEVEVGGQTIEIKAKVTEGFIAYLMKLL